MAVPRTRVGHQFRIRSVGRLLQPRGRARSLQDARVPSAPPMFLHDRGDRHACSRASPPVPRPPKSACLQFRWHRRHRSSRQRHVSLNIPYAYADLRFNPSVRPADRFLHPLDPVRARSSTRTASTIGVTQVLNKKGGVFYRRGRAAPESRSPRKIAIALENSKLFDDVQRMTHLQRKHAVKACRTGS